MGINTCVSGSQQSSDVQGLIIFASLGLDAQILLPMLLLFVRLKSASLPAQAAVRPTHPGRCGPC